MDDVSRRGVSRGTVDSGRRECGHGGRPGAGAARQRLRTLALADQIGEDHWREPLLPGGRTLHDQLTHLLAWDEWAVGAFEISALRPLPPTLVEALRDSTAYNARTEQRYRRITRDDVMSALQGMVDRVLISAARSAPSGQPWLERRIADLAGARIVVDAATGVPVAAGASGPSVARDSAAPTRP